MNNLHKIFTSCSWINNNSAILSATNIETRSRILFRIMGTVIAELPAKNLQ